jgi:hypothetical protein
MYDREQSLKRLKEYVIEKGKYSEGKWVTLVAKATAAEILNCGSTHAHEMIKVFAAESYIESEIDENYAKAGKKPLRFRMKEQTKCSEVALETKRAYPFLSDVEVEKSMNALKEHNLNDKNVIEMLKMLNVLGNNPPRHEVECVYVLDAAAYMSDLLLIPLTRINVYIDILVTCGLIAMRDGNARLFPKDLQDIKKSTVAKPTTINVELEGKPLPVVTPTKVIQPELPVVEKPVHIPSQEAAKVETPNEDLMKILIDNIGDFTGFISSFQSFFAGAYAELKKPEADPEEMKTLIAKLDELEKEHESLKESSNRGAVALEKCYKDNSRLREELGIANRENREHKKVCNAFKQNTDSEFEFMSGRFEVVIAEITNLISDFNRIPNWKITETDRAKFQNQVVNAITTAISDILKHKTKYTGE